MKKLIPMLLMTLVFLVGVASIGEQYEFKATQSITFVVAASILIAASGRKFGLRDGIDVSAVASELGEYMRVYTAQIWRKVYQQLEFEKYMRKIGNQRGKFSSLQSSATDVLQAFQPGFTAKGKTTFTAYVNEVYRTKVDYLLDDIDEIYAGYLGFMGDENRNRADWPLVKYIVEEHIIPKIAEELDIASARGVYVAPTTGTPGNSINICNGILTLITNEIAATNLTAITTGAITVSDALDKFETFVEDIEDLDPSVLTKKAKIFCSKTMERYYKHDYRANFGQYNDPMSKNRTKLDNYDVEIVGLRAFGNSNRLLLAPEGNLLVGYDKIYVPNSFKVEEARREVAIMTDFHRGYGFGTLDQVFASDQA